MTAANREPPPLDHLRTERLVLRRWRATDRAPFADLNADHQVMAYVGSTLSRKDSDEWVDRIEADFAVQRFGLWAVEVIADSSFIDSPLLIGFVGLSVPSFEAAFTPCVEVGWRLAREAWGYGYATEAGQEAVADGFARLGLAEIVSFTTATNVRSRRVMERLGMTHDPADDFDHPRKPEGDPLRPHVLYRLARP